MEPYRPNCYKIPELNGLRVLLVFIVSWYHFWQQSWLTPSIGSYSLDYLLRAGYMPVDGTILLSGFLLFLPYARAMLLGEAVPNTKQFYQRRIMRIVPSYYFVTLALLFAVALPWHLYYNSSDMVRDVVMHLTFTQTFNPATYIATPIGVASWTIAIEMQAYLIFPLLARWAMKNPLGTLMTMAAGSFAFRGWCVWRLDEYNMVVNQLANFLDIYALGMGAALLYVWLVQCYLAAEKRKAMAWQGIATLLCVLSTWGMLRIFRVQAGESGQAALQAGQMMRRPLLGLAVAGILLTLPFAARPLRFLMGNRVMGWLAAVSMNYYLLHQNLAVHLKRLGVPPSVSAEPNRAGEQPWQLQYTLLCFGLSLLQNTKMVLSARFRLSRVFIISPTVQSSCRITSPRVPIPLFPAKRAWGTRGTCTSCVPMYIKKGSSLCLIIKSFALPVMTSAMSSSTQRADLPPVIQPIRGIPFTIVLLCP